MRAVYYNVSGVIWAVYNNGNLSFGILPTFLISQVVSPMGSLIKQGPLYQLIRGAITHYKLSGGPLALRVCSMNHDLEESSTVFLIVFSACTDHTSAAIYDELTEVYGGGVLIVISKCDPCDAIRVVWSVIWISSLHRYNLAAIRQVRWQALTDRELWWWIFYHHSNCMYFCVFTAKNKVY